MGPDGIFPLTFAAVTRMDQWMRDVVRGHRGFSVAERRSFAVQLAYHLFLGSCPCGLPSCQRRHSVKVHNPEQIGLPLFVEQAVIGPTGCQANSVAQGMFYRLILRVEYGMQVDKVELNRCADPRCPMDVYEEERCPGDGCSSVYTSDDTEVIAQERLFIQGVYLWVRRFCCKKRGDPGEHYFRQRLCRDRMTVEFVDNPQKPGDVVPVVRHHVVCNANNGHDFCPWCGCPHGKPQHSQRATTLWVRSELAGGRPPAVPSDDPQNPTDPTDPTELQRLAAFEEGVRDWWDALDQPTRDDLQAAFAKDLSPSSEMDDDPLMIADWLLSSEQSPTTATQCQSLHDAITWSFKVRGLER